ncbi:MAG: protein translocase subunit SecF [Alphaproteobacteria bacterium]|nr:protein translocase subunit SecF [Alphaproteobacteria bacterium]MDD9920162.1 protein translocase subunit SecF [Alphaproteobacteria bacterium]
MSIQIILKGTLIDFLKYRAVALVLSGVFLLATVGLLFAKGLNFGIDFTGGALVQIQTEQAYPVGQLRDVLKDKGLVGLTIQEYGSPQEFIVRFPLSEGSAAEAAAHEIQKALGDELGAITIRRVEFVGPQIGAELREKGLMAILVSLIVILLYISMRFEMRYGVGAVAALCHDVLLTVGIFSLMQKEVTLPVLAALLTIIGYSLNDTIVVFDRIRENRGKDRKGKFIGILNLSLSQTLSRTIMTSITTLLVLLALFLWGGEVIHDFAFTLLFGVVVGTYSSIFIASPVLLLMEGYYQKLAMEEENENKGA